MRLALIYALVAMAFYAVEIVITDLQLGKIPARVVTLMYATGVAILAGTSLLIFPEKEFVWPSRKEWGFVVLMVIVSFVAATTHFLALHNKAGSTTMGAYYSLLPVTAALLIYFFAKEQQLPSWRMVLAWVLGAIAIYLVSTEKK